MRVKVFGPFSSYGPGTHPNRVMMSWAPDQTVDVDDSDADAVAFYRGLIAGGLAEHLDSPEPDIPEPEPTPVPAGAGKTETRTTRRTSTRSQ